MSLKLPPKARRVLAWWVVVGAPFAIAGEIVIGLNNPGIAFACYWSAAVIAGGAVWAYFAVIRKPAK